MNKEDFENIFENDDFITSLLNSIEDENFYINDKEPVYTLRECLENIKGEDLSTIYLTYKQILTIDKKLKDKPTSKEMIDILEEEILRLFPEFLTTLNSDDKNILNESLKNKELEISNITLLNNGYMFGFTKNNKNVYVVPNEIKELYKEYVSNGELEKIEYNNAYLYIFVYMIINGFVPKEFLYKVLTCKYKLNITKKEINNMVLKFCHEYKEYYSLFEVTDEGKEAIDSLLEIKNSIPYHILEEAELGYYFELIKSLHDEIDNILKKTNITGEMIVNRFILDDLPTEDLLSEFNLTKTQSKKIFDLMDEAKNSLRYWTYNGRTTNEFERDYWISNLTFNKKPKNTNLDSCLSILELDTYDEIFNNFDEDGKLLDEKIINYAKKIAKEYEKFQIAGLINSNHEELNNLINFDEVSHGLVYFYEEDDKVKCLVPDEIIEIMHNAYHQKDDIEEYTENLISIYIDMNGVITKNKLQELLKEYHDIDISIKELDYKVRELDACIIKNKYYTWVEDFPIDAIEDLMVVKEAFNKYKKVNFENEYKESEFKDKVKDIIENENSKDDFIENVYSIILHFAKNAVLDKESLNESLEDNGIILKEKTKKQIIDLYKDYKKYISVWYYNGHTILEYADIINKKSVKIGRNEPCPCGSGKKYKKCCGK